MLSVVRGEQLWTGPDSTLSSLSPVHSDILSRSKRLSSSSPSSLASSTRSSMSSTGDDLEFVQRPNLENKLFYKTNSLDLDNCVTRSQPVEESVSDRSENFNCATGSLESANFNQIIVERNSADLVKTAQKHETVRGPTASQINGFEGRAERSPLHLEKDSHNSDLEQSNNEEFLRHERRYFVTPKKARWKLHDRTSEELESVDDIPEDLSPSHSSRPSPPLPSSPQIHHSSPLGGTVHDDSSENISPKFSSSEVICSPTHISSSQCDLTQAERLSVLQKLPHHREIMDDYDENENEDDSEGLYLQNQSSYYAEEGREELYADSNFGGVGKGWRRSSDDAQIFDQEGDMQTARLRNVNVFSKDILSCHLCPFIGEDEESYTAHMRAAHFKNQCPYCGYSSRTIGRLRRHVTDFHSNDGSGNFSGTDPNKARRQRRYRCRECNFISDDQTKYWTHIRIHIPTEKQLLCPHCAFVTACKHHMEYHLRNHLGSKPFKCNCCNYQCINKAMLKSHMKSHSNVYPYRCADCSYAAKYVHALNMHLQKTGHTVWVDGDGKSARTGRNLTRLRGQRRNSAKFSSGLNGKVEGLEREVDLESLPERKFIPDLQAYQQQQEQKLQLEKQLQQQNHLQLQLHQQKQLQLEQQYVNRHPQQQLHEEREQIRLQQLQRQQVEQQQLKIRQELQGQQLQLIKQQQQHGLQQENRQQRDEYLLDRYQTENGFQTVRVNREQSPTEYPTNGPAQSGGLSRILSPNGASEKNKHLAQQSDYSNIRSPNDAYDKDSLERLYYRRRLTPEDVQGRIPERALQGQTIPSITSFSRCSAKQSPPPLMLYDPYDSKVNLSEGLVKQELNREELSESFVRHQSAAGFVRDVPFSESERRSSNAWLIDRFNVISSMEDNLSRERTVVESRGITVRDRCLTESEQALMLFRDSRQIPLDLSSAGHYLQPDEWKIASRESEKLEEGEVRRGGGSADGVSRKRSPDWGVYEGRNRVAKRARTADWPYTTNQQDNAASIALRDQNCATISSEEIRQLQSNVYDSTVSRPRAGSFPSSLARESWKVGQERAAMNIERERVQEREYLPSQYERSESRQSQNFEHNRHSVLEKVSNAELLPHYQNERSQYQYGRSNYRNEYDFEHQSVRAPWCESEQISAEVNISSDASLRNTIDRLYGKIEEEKLKKGRSLAEIKLNEAVVESMECEFCRIIFPDYILYTLHMGYHSRDDPFRCNKCGHVTKNHREFFQHVAQVAHD